MTDERPNIMLIMTDQQRGDCLGLEGTHPVLTPNLDALAADGVLFTRAYSTCPICIPARRSLLSGQFPATHGLAGYVDRFTCDVPHTLPGVLRDAGYQTQLVGRSMHQWPPRRRFGYDEMTINADYQHWLDLHLDVDVGNSPGPGHRGAYYSTGPMHNDWTSRPWPYPEDLHFTNWTISQARRFLGRRDPSCPFFLTVSFLAPHPPLIPPPFYFNRYLRTPLPDPVVGQWADPVEGPVAPDSPRVDLTGEALRSCLAGYYGLINHIDDQLRRLLNPYDRVGGYDPADTVIMFTADHGEMLGDHHRWRKSLPYEGAARIPMILRAPERFGLEPGTCDAPVCLEDVMPTILDLADVPVPDSVEGRSMVPLARRRASAWRDCLHLEHAPTFHALANGHAKYVWFVADGREQLFDLDADPRECRDLTRDPGHSADLATWRQRMVTELRGRPEGFVRDGELISGQPYPPTL